MKKNIVVTGKDELTRTAFCEFIKNHLGEVNCVACADGESAMEFIRKYPIRLVILDLFLPGGNGLGLVQKIKDLRRNISILCYCRDMNKLLGVRAANAGATALADFSEDLERFSDRVLKAFHGIPCYPEWLQSLLDEHDFEKNPQNYTEITDSQLQAISLITEGMTAKQMADVMGISEAMVNKFKDVIKKKLGLVSAAQIPGYAVTHGLVEKED